MSTDEYVPSEDDLRHAYRCTRLLDHHADVNGAFDRFLARVRRDAKAEAEARIQAVRDVLDAEEARPRAIGGGCDTRTTVRITEIRRALGSDPPPAA